MANEPRSMEEVAALMRENLPDGMTPAEFGQGMKWGRGSDKARSRIESLTAEELLEVGLSTELATNWAVAYEAAHRLMPKNPSAEGRAELMHHAAELLSGE